MANRIVLDANGLRVSKPGYDVFSAGPENLIFDTNAGLLVHYTFTMSAVGNGGVGTLTQDIGYPSLGYYPIFAMQLFLPTGYSDTGVNNACHQGWPSPPAVQYPYAKLTSYTNVRITYPASFTFTIRVVLFKNRGN